MKFERFEGSKDAGKRADFAEGVKGTSASEASKRDASGKPDRQSLSTAILDCQAELSAVKTRITQIETRLAQLNRMVQGRRLPTNEYRTICDEQAQLQEEKTRTITHASDLKVRLGQLKHDLLGCETKAERSESKLETTNKLLKLILIELRKLTDLARSTRTTVAPHDPPAG